MPICVVEFFDVDIGNERGLCAKSLSVQGQSERLSDRAVTATGANKIFRCHQLPGGVPDLYSAHFRRHRFECGAKVDLTTSLGPELSPDLLYATCRSDAED